MTDMTQTIAPKSNQLNADDLTGGRSITVKITKVSAATAEQPIAINYEGDNGKPYYPCKSMRRVFVAAWGFDGAAYVGRSMTLYCDPKVIFGGIAVGGIRISHMSHIKEPLTVVLTASKTVRKPFIVQPLATAPEADPALVEAGKAASQQGIEAFTAWGKTLTPAQKSDLRPHLAGWTKDAKAGVAVSATPPTCPTCSGKGMIPYSGDEGDGTQPCPACSKTIAQKVRDKIADDPAYVISAG